MTEVAQGSAFQRALVGHGLLLPSGTAGLYGYSGAFDRIICAIDAMLSRVTAADDAEIMRFPPMMSRPNFEKSGYLKNFPHLAGIVHSYTAGCEGHAHLWELLQSGGDWTRDLQATQVALIPAACYPVYPLLSGRGSVPAGGWLIDVGSFCFRHEPSADPARLQCFRQREQVRIGDADQVTSFRDRWMQRAREIAEALHLPHDLQLANDPFFGRTGQLMRESQRQRVLKYELLIPIDTEMSETTACVSFNAHLDLFSKAWGLETPQGEPAYTGCVGFGLERLTLALFRHHGLNASSWPKSVRQHLLL